jgi:cell division protein FtsB
VIRRRRDTRKEGVIGLLADTDALVSRLVAENRALRAHNARLEREVERLTEGWTQIKRLARIAPRTARR